MADAMKTNRGRARTEALEQVGRLINDVASFNGLTAKATLADYVRLVQLEREILGEEAPGEGGAIRWTDTVETDSSTDE